MPEKNWEWQTQFKLSISTCLTVWILITAKNNFSRGIIPTAIPRTLKKRIEKSYSQQLITSGVVSTHQNVTRLLPQFSATPNRLLHTTGNKYRFHNSSATQLELQNMAKRSSHGRLFAQIRRQRTRFRCPNHSQKAVTMSIQMDILARNETDWGGRGVYESLSLWIW